MTDDLRADPAWPAQMECDYNIDRSIVWDRHIEDPGKLDEALRRLYVKYEHKHRVNGFARVGLAITDDDSCAITRGKLNDTAALDAVRAWLEMNGRGKTDPRMLVLLGGVGTGKTVAASWAVWETGDGEYVVPDQLHERLHPHRSEGKRPGGNGRILVIDDVGTESDPRFGPALFEIVNARMSYGLTILTGNLTRAQFAERYDPRVIDRLNHCGKLFEVGGDSLRRKEGGL